jgi:hypothetical protein
MIQGFAPPTSRLNEDSQIVLHLPLTYVFTQVVWAKRELKLMVTCQWLQTSDAGFGPCHDRELLYFASWRARAEKRRTILAAARAELG